MRATFDRSTAASAVQPAGGDDMLPRKSDKM
jgi:hypothetical protein